MTLVISLMDSLRTLQTASFWQVETVNAEVLSDRINSQHRSAVLKWLFESLSLLNIEDRVFFSTVSIADRYCAQLSHRSITNNTPVEGSELQLIILSALCCSLKAVESSLDLSVKSFLEHVSGGHVLPRDIFATESTILLALDFNVFSPSLSVYLESFYFTLSRSSTEMTSGPLEQPASPRPLPNWALQQYNLALFLLYLIVFDIGTLHAARASLVVSACILTSAFTLCDEKLSALEFQTIVDALIEAEWIEVNRHNVTVIVRHMVRFWKRMSSDNGEVFRSVSALFDSDEKLRVNRIAPPRHIAGHDAKIASSGG